MERTELVVVRTDGPLAGGIGEAGTAAVHGGVQAADSGRGGCLLGAGDAWRIAPARGPLLVALVDMAEATRRGRPGRPDAQVAPAISGPVISGSGIVLSLFMLVRWNP